MTIKIKLHPVKTYVLLILQYPPIPQITISDTNKMNLQKIEKKKNKPYGSHTMKDFLIIKSHKKTMQKKKQEQNQ